MSITTNVYAVNLEDINRILSAQDESVAEKAAQAVIREQDWTEGEDRQWLFDVARRVIIDGDLSCENAGWVFYGLALLGDSESLDDGWDFASYQDMMINAEAFGLSEQACDLLEAIVAGRTPTLDKITEAGGEAIGAFLTAEEADELVGELLDSVELKDAADEEITETAYDHLVPTLDRELPDGYGFFFFSH